MQREDFQREINSIENEQLAQFDRYGMSTGNCYLIQPRLGREAKRKFNEIFQPGYREAEEYGVYLGTWGQTYAFLNHEEVLKDRLLFLRMFEEIAIHEGLHYAW